MERASMREKLTIENVPEDLLASLRERAERSGGTLQSELLAILEEAMSTRERLTPAQVLEQTRRLGLSTADEATALVRADRDAG